MVIDAPAEAGQRDEQGWKKAPDPILQGNDDPCRDGQHYSQYRRSIKMILEEENADNGGGHEFHIEPDGD